MYPPECDTGKACGKSCIAVEKTCHKTTSGGNELALAVSDSSCSKALHEQIAILKTMLAACPDTSKDEDVKQTQLALKVETVAFNVQEELLLHKKLLEKIYPLAVAMEQYLLEKTGGRSPTSGGGGGGGAEQLLQLEGSGPSPSSEGMTEIEALIQKLKQENQQLKQALEDLVRKTAESETPALPPPPPLVVSIPPSDANPEIEGSPAFEKSSAAVPLETLLGADTDTGAAAEEPAAAATTTSTESDVMQLSTTTSNPDVLEIFETASQQVSTLPLATADRNAVRDPVKFAHGFMKKLYDSSERDVSLWLQEDSSEFTTDNTLACYLKNSKSPRVPADLVRRFIAMVVMPMKFYKMTMTIPDDVKQQILEISARPASEMQQSREELRTLLQKMVSAQYEALAGPENPDDLDRAKYMRVLARYFGDGCLTPDQMFSTSSAPSVTDEYIRIVNNAIGSRKK